MSKEETILNYMKKLDLTRQEAEQLYEDDNGAETAEQKELAKKAKANGRHYETDKTKRKTTPKERKVDTTKRDMFDAIKKALIIFGATITGIKTETELMFDFNNEHYSLKLTRHKQPKS